MEQTVHYLVIQPGVTAADYDEPGAITIHASPQSRLGDDIRSLIGGWFDVAPGLHDAAIFVDDEGLLKGLTSNIVATTLHLYTQHLVGVAVIAGPPDAEGNTTSVPDAVIQRIGQTYGFPIVDAAPLV